MLKKRIALFLSITSLLTMSVIGSNVQTPLCLVEQSTDNNIEFKTSLQMFNTIKEEAIKKRVEEEKQRLRIEEENRLKEIKRLEEARVVTYNPNNILEKSNITNEEAYVMLEGSALQTLSRAYVEAERVYGVNAIWLMALNSEESARGESSLAMSNNNLGGVKTRSGEWAYFSDWGECLFYISNMIKTEYLTEDGLFFNGYSIYSINEKYCVGGNWSENINTIAYELLEKVK